MRASQSLRYVSRSIGGSTTVLRVQSAGSSIWSTLHIDDPALCTRNTVVDPPMDRETYRKDCEARIEATNWALRGLPEERILYHTCWGSFHTPHTTDLPFDWIIDLLPKFNVGAFSVEAADVRHELDFQL